MANVYGNPAQGYALEPGKKVDAYGYVEGSQHYNAETDAMKAANPNPNPSGGGFVGGNSVPVDVTSQGISIGGAKPVPQTPNIAQAPGYTASNSNVALTPEQQKVQGAYNSASQTINTDIQSRYKAAAANLPNTPAPSSAAEGVKTAKDIVGPPPAPLTAGQQFVTNDPTFQNIQSLISEHFKPENQRTSLVDEYKKMLGETGIQGLDTELLNMKHIIEGTEDDIRNEVTKAGGFATDSQVQALSIARNKQLVKNYNNLLETRNSKEKYLDTLMNLTAKDREEADKQFETMLNLDFKIADYQEKMQTNARQSFQKIVDSVGYSGAYDSALKSGDPTAISRAEKLLGVDPGQLPALAELDRTTRAQAQQKADLQNQVLESNLKTDQAQRANIYSQIESRKAEEAPINGVPAKVLNQLKTSPEYKTINAVLPAISAIKAYKEAIDKYGTGEMLSGEGEGILDGTYSNALVAWKSLAALGALSGADFSLAESAIPKPSLFTRTSKQQAKLEASLQNALTQTDALTKRLTQNYPEAASLLNQQLADIKMTKPTESTLNAQPQTMTLNGKTYTKGADGKYY